MKNNFLQWDQLGEKKYKSETIVRAFEYFAVSRAAYNMFRQDYELPSITLLTSITSTVKHFNDDAYLKAVFSKVEICQKSCILLLDEVYVKPALQYHGGNIFGKATNKPDVLANTILSFMIVCQFGGPKFLYKLLPVASLDTDFLHQQTNLIVKTIAQSGGQLRAIICDGNRVNQSLFKKIQGTQVPWKTDNGIYLLYDYVHIMKNIRNNWITEKTQELECIINGEKFVAKWSDIKDLHQKESNQIVHMSRLTDVAVYPKPIERQKVSFCLKVFCDDTIAALRNHPEILNANGTILFMEKVLLFWKIVNVHSPYTAIQKRDEMRSSISRDDDPNLKVLQDFGQFALDMCDKKVDSKRYKSLTKDTGRAIWHTCNGLVELSKHLLLTTHDFVLLGEFTSDPLEKQFGETQTGVRRNVFHYSATGS